jgi:tartrate-resistant acid phosphatase type 5
MSVACPRPGVAARAFAAAVFAVAALASARTPEPPGRAAPGAGSAPAGSFDFLVIGDWGRGGSRIQRQVAEAMAAWSAVRPARFVISVGDNFYGYGVSSVTDPKWKAAFEDVYVAKALQVPWYVALGNHDYRGNVEAQIEYSRWSTRWRMPARHYTFTEPAGGGVRVQFFVLDTSPFLGAYRSFFSFTKVAGQDAGAQRAWLEKELAASTAEWKIVVGHHPICSSGPHGDAKELVRDIRPLLERYGVAAYLNGHEHVLEHLRSGPVEYFTSGGGSEVTRVSPDPRVVWAEAVAGFMAFTVAPDALRVSVVDAAGSVRHTAAIPRQAPVP